MTKILCLFILYIPRKTTWPIRSSRIQIKNRCVSSVKKLSHGRNLPSKCRSHDNLSFGNTSCFQKCFQHLFNNFNCFQQLRTFNNDALDCLIHKFRSKKAAIKCKSSCLSGRHFSSKCHGVSMTCTSMEI